MCSKTSEPPPEDLAPTRTGSSLWKSEMNVLGLVYTWRNAGQEWLFIRGICKGERIPSIRTQKSLSYVSITIWETNIFSTSHRPKKVYPATLSSQRGKTQKTKRKILVAGPYPHPESNRAPQYSVNISNKSGIWKKRRDAGSTTGGTNGGNASELQISQRGNVVIDDSRRLWCVPPSSLLVLKLSSSPLPLFPLGRPLKLSNVPHSPAGISGTCQMSISTKMPATAASCDTNTLPTPATV
ncbi:hypothetical protein Hypma_008354 [Hypsizygus marmoreus]|uniref:Uncharacterized protein n=1 Tax=Hypsizygus marmoreus TaxID=39966 RepID=A0A369JT32_HYPMA|nr:hypothetical protein Hypma_008354 [Hypsizygus marmoreus]